MLRQRSVDRAVDDERDRIARDLHDTVLQRLFHTGMVLRAASLTLGPATSSDDDIAAAIAEITEAMRELRTVVFPLRKAPEALPFEASVYASIAEARRLLPCEVIAEIQPDLDRVVPGDTCHELLMIVREALTNVAKHASASQVRIAVNVDAGSIHLRITDDGVGFSTSDVTGGHGLRNLGDRARLLGGYAEIASEPNRGTRLTITVPLNIEPFSVEPLSVVPLNVEPWGAVNERHCHAFG